MKLELKRSTATKAVIIAVGLAVTAAVVFSIVAVVEESKDDDEFRSARCLFQGG